MKIHSDSFGHGQALPSEFAAGVYGDDGPVPGPNRSPHLAWNDLPDGTQSIAIVCHDRDAPTRPDLVNRSDATVPYDIPRVDFDHWVLVDIPVSMGELAVATDGEGFTARGKQPGPTDHGCRGINDFTNWFADDDDMSGDYGGYDGPWPPFNDERLHHYVFTVYALDVNKLELRSRFTGGDAINAMEGHVLDLASIVATYSLHPDPQD